MAADLLVAKTAYVTAHKINGVDERVLLSLFEAGLVESGMRNLTWGDRDSVGYLQQRPSAGWPNPTNVEVATRSYITQAVKNAKKNPSWSAGKLAQSVQRSAYPDRYDTRKGEAQALLDKVRGSKTPDGGDGGGIGLPGVPLGGLVDAVKGIGTGVGNIGKSTLAVGQFAEKLVSLALPSNLMRMTAGLIGTLLVIAGLIMLGREVRN